MDELWEETLVAIHGRRIFKRGDKTTAYWLASYTQDNIILSDTRWEPEEKFALRVDPNKEFEPHPENDYDYLAARYCFENLYPRRLENVILLIRENLDYSFPFARFPEVEDHAIFNVRLKRNAATRELR